MTEHTKRHIAILGSTGSIGTQALDVIREHRDRFRVSVLTGMNRAERLIEQAREFHPDTVVIANESHYRTVKDALADLPIKVFAGDEAVAQAAEMAESEMVLTALVGFSGLKPTLSAIRAGKAIALANKETLVVGGAIVTQEAQMQNVPIIPVDSEHSAIWQCLAGESLNPVEKIILTASGGPFRGFTREQLKHVTAQQALKHPNWDMGAKITVDSATLFNKGLEVIEAHWLFGLNAKQIDIIVHPQSIIHSMVQFQDGSMKAQMGLPDMKLPIQYAMGYPARIANSFPRFSFLDYPTLTFQSPDREAFPSIGLSYHALQMSGNMPCILNAANEVAVKHFLQGSIGFTDIFHHVEAAMGKIGFIGHPSIDDLFTTDAETRRWVESRITQTSQATR